VARFSPRQIPSLPRQRKEGLKTGENHNVSGLASSQLGSLAQIRRECDKPLVVRFNERRLIYSASGNQYAGDMQGYLFFSGPALSLRFEHVSDPQACYAAYRR
jgi:hypothetical protein